DGAPGAAGRHAPRRAGGEGTAILGVQAGVAAVNRPLDEHDFAWCELVDNGGLASRPGSRAYHLAPVGTGKVNGVAVDRRRHDIDRGGTFYIGDSAADLACAPEVSECWLVANAEPDLGWP